MSEDFAADAEVFAALRSVWTDVDPVPVDLVDRMVAAVAVEGLTHEYALLTLVEDADLAAVRGDADMLTMSFTDGQTSVLLHVTKTGAHTRRVDGWVDAPALAIRLAQEDHEWGAEATDHGRFEFDDVTPGLTRLRLVIKAEDGLQEFATGHFEV